MGVPSFFRWLVRRYPEVVQPPGSDGCDNLYLDMNGLIHPCFHPEDGEPQPESEEEVFGRVLQAVDEIIAVARPRRLVYLAVDGPAPRAKMNQQRGRRYVKGHEAAVKQRMEEEHRERFQREKGKRLPASRQPLDSNVITPGTRFMATLGRWLRHWAHLTLNAELPPGFRIVLSDAAVPGEGEHKLSARPRIERGTFTRALPCPLAEGHDSIRVRPSVLHPSSAPRSRV